jgi:uncharacterized membrane protein
MTQLRIDINKYIDIVLGTGVILSLLILIWGSILTLLNPESIKIGAAIKPGPLLHVLSGVGRMDPISTIYLGLFVLIITPVARVIAAGIVFAANGERKYALIALIVFVILLLSSVLNK